jgi:phage-related holin
MNYLINNFKGIYDLFKSEALLLIQIIGAFILPIKPLIILMIMMIGIDTVTGLIKAKKTKDPITSRKLSAVVSKIVLYCTGIIAIYALDRFLLGELVASFTSIKLFLTKITTVFFIGIEVISVNENVTKAFNLNLFETFKKMVFRIKEVKEDLTDLGKKD